MKKKTNQEEQESKKIQEMEEKLKESENQSALLREMTNLKDESYYRLQKLQTSQQILTTLQNLTEAVKELDLGEEESEEDTDEEG